MRRIAITAATLICLLPAVSGATLQLPEELSSFDFSTTSSQLLGGTDFIDSVLAVRCDDLSLGDLSLGDLSLLGAESFGDGGALASFFGGLIDIGIRILNDRIENGDFCNAVPEPTAAVVFGLGLVMVGRATRRSR